MAWIDPGTAVDSAMSSIASAGLLSYLIEWLKKNEHIGFVTADKKTLLRWMNALSALMVAAGLHMVYDTDGVAPGMMARVVIDIPAWTTILSGLWAWGQQWSLQQMAYDGFVSKADPPKLIMVKGPDA
jgi:hypothetical protein